MKYIASLVALATLTLFTPLRSSADGDLLARMAAVNPSLHSYTATLHAHVALTSFPFISTDLAGTYYHKDPDLDKVDITSGLPGIGAQFSKLYPHLVPASQWQHVYVIKLVSDDGKVSVFKLVPRKKGNVDHLDATVDDVAATVVSMRWNYDNGGTAETSNTYSQVDGNLLVTAQTGSVNEPSYKGNITSTLDNYVINPNIPDTTFQEQ